jgi:hypothetical protein
MSDFYFNPSSESHETAFRGCHESVCIAGKEVDDVHDCAPDMLSPCKYYQTIPNIDSFIFDGVGKTGVVARNDLHSQLSVRMDGEPWCKRRER